MRVVQLTLKGEFVAVHESLREGAREANTHHGHISSCLRGRRRSSGGYKWVKEEDYLFDNINWKKKGNKVEADIPSGDHSFNVEAIMNECSLNPEEWECSDFKAGKHQGFIKNSEKKVETVTLRNCKAVFRRKYLEKPSNKFYDEFLDDISRDLIGKLGKPTKRARMITGDVDVIHTGDLHLGALVKKDGNGYEAEFNIDIAKDRLGVISDYITDNKKPIIFTILGDLIESFTGKNHADTWQYIESHGMELALKAYDILQEFIDQNPLIRKVGIMSGNHDRVSDKKDEDGYGQVAYLLHGLLKRTMPQVEFMFDRRILSFKQNDMVHICHHGHLGISKNSLEKMIVDYGDSSLFNLVVGAHRHSRGIDADTMNGRKIWIPSFTSTNHYASDIGAHSLSGFTHVKTIKNYPIITDIPLIND